MNDMSSKFVHSNGIRIRNHISLIGKESKFLRQHKLKRIQDNSVLQQRNNEKVCPTYFFFLYILSFV